MAEASDQSDVKIGFVTDCEGNLNHFKRYVEISEVLDFVPGSTSDLSLRDGAHFVFGGDMFDKGPGDLRLSRMLVRLKRRYPTRVHLLIGNRDVNKTKLTAELHESDVSGRDPRDIPGPFWLPEEGRPTPAAFLKEVAGGEDIRLANTRVNRLKYLLRDTMGCAGTFELRRAEVAEVRGVPVADVDDDAVLASFVDSLEAEDGCVREVLEVGQAAACIGNTLFVHGAVTNESYGFLPHPQTRCRPFGEGQPPGVEMMDRPTQEWVDALNAFLKASLDEWKDNMRWNEDRTWRGGEAAMAYNHNEAMNRRTVMVNAAHGDGRMVELSDEVVARLRASGVVRVLSGHKPCGDSPMIGRGPIELIVADTSYSDMSAEDGRGLAVAEVCVRGSLTRNRAHVHGVRADGVLVDFCLPLRCATGEVGEADPEGDDLVGRGAADGWFVKARTMEDPPRYVLSKVDGRRHSYRYVTPEEATAEVAAA